MKPLHIRLFEPAVRHSVQQIFIWLHLTSFITCLCPREHWKIIVEINHMISVASYFKPRGFLILQRIAHFCFDSELTGGKYKPKNKIMYLKFSEIVLLTSAGNMSNWRKTYPNNSLQRYWIFALATSVTGASGFRMKFMMNNKNSSGSPLSNKAILNS